MRCQVSGEVLKPPVAIPWYPAKLAWQLDANRTQLRKIAALGRLHDFMKRENDAGGITRQEAVSMVPPLLLDVQPHHLVGALNPADLAPAMMLPHCACWL